MTTSPTGDQNSPTAPDRVYRLDSRLQRKTDGKPVVNIANVGVADASVITVDDDSVVRLNASSPNVVVDPTLSGSGAPAADLGANNNFYVDTDDNKLYFKHGGTWSFLFGEEGDAGADGEIPFFLFRRSDTALTSSDRPIGIVVEAGGTIQDQPPWSQHVGLGAEDLWFTYATGKRGDTLGFIAPIPLSPSVAFLIAKLTPMLVGGERVSVERSGNTFQFNAYQHEVTRTIAGSLVNFGANQAFFRIDTQDGKNYAWIAMEGDSYLSRVTGGAMRISYGSTIVSVAIRSGSTDSIGSHSVRKLEIASVPSIPSGTSARIYFDQQIDAAASQGLDTRQVDARILPIARTAVTTPTDTQKAAFRARIGVSTTGVGDDVNSITVDPLVEKVARASVPDPDVTRVDRIGFLERINAMDQGGWITRNLLYFDHTVAQTETTIDIGSTVPASVGSSIPGGTDGHGIEMYVKDLTDTSPPALITTVEGFRRLQLSTAGGLQVDGYQIHVTVNGKQIEIWRLSGDKIGLSFNNTTWNTGDRAYLFFYYRRPGIYPAAIQGQNLTANGQTEFRNRIGAISRADLPAPPDLTNLPAPQLYDEVAQSVLSTSVVRLYTTNGLQARRTRYDTSLTGDDLYTNGRLLIEATAQDSSFLTVAAYPAGDARNVTHTETTMRAVQQLGSFEGVTSLTTLLNRNDLINVGSANFYALGQATRQTLRQGTVTLYLGRKNNRVPGLVVSWVADTVGTQALPRFNVRIRYVPEPEQRIALAGAQTLGGINGIPVFRWNFAASATNVNTHAAAESGTNTSRVVTPAGTELGFAASAAGTYQALQVPATFGWSLRGYSGLRFFLQSATAIAATPTATNTTAYGDFPFTAIMDNATIGSSTNAERHVVMPDGTSFCSLNVRRGTGSAVAVYPTVNSRKTATAAGKILHVTLY